MKRTAVIIVLVAACIGSVLWVALTRQKRTPEIVVGIMTPLTGDVASWGDMQRKASDLALEEINAAGGIHGRRVRLVYEDDQATPKIGLSAFKKLIDVDHVPIVVGSPASGVTLAVAPTANERKVVLLSSGSTATAVGTAGPYVFRIMPSDEVQARIMTDWAKELGINRVAVIYAQNAWGQGLKDAFESAFKSLGGSITASEGTSQDTTDFRGQLTKISSAKPDAIYAPLYTRSAGLMVRQARELGLKQRVLGADVYETPEFVQVAQNAADGVLFTRYGSYNGPEYQVFARKYTDRYGRQPEAYATYCYDALRIAMFAMGKCPQDSLTGSRIHEALLKIADYKGVTGTTSFNASNSASGKGFDRLTFVGGKVVPWSQQEDNNRGVHHGH